MNSSNSQSFNLIKRVSQSFSLLSKGISVATTLILRMFSRIDLNFTLSFLLSFFLTMRVKTIRMTSLVLKIITKSTQSISVKRVRGSYTLRERQKAIGSLSFLSPILFVAKLRQKLIVSLSSKKIIGSYTPTIATFFTLLTFDPQTLLVLDTETLGEMDYTA